jgi:hypothetical protein
MTIPTFGVFHLPGPDWVVLINSPCEGGGTPEASPGPRLEASVATCPVPEPKPEPRTLMLLTTGWAGLLAAAYWQRLRRRRGIPTSFSQDLSGKFRRR